MRTRCRVSGLSSGETCPDINRAVGLSFCARAFGGLGRSHIFRGPDLLLGLLGTLVCLLRIALPTEQLPLQSGRPQCHRVVFGYGVEDYLLELLGREVGFALVLAVFVLVLELGQRLELADCSAGEERKQVIVAVGPADWDIHLANAKILG